jgi:hypothetical protein
MLDNTSSSRGANNEILYRTVHKLSNTGNKNQELSVSQQLKIYNQSRFFGGANIN